MSATGHYYLATILESEVRFEFVWSFRRLLKRLIGAKSTAENGTLAMIVGKSSLERDC